MHCWRTKRSCSFHMATPTERLAIINKIDPARVEELARYARLYLLERRWRIDPEAPLKPGMAIKALLMECLKDDLKSNPTSDQV